MASISQVFFSYILIKDPKAKIIRIVHIIKAYWGR
jgi:hypothetical protein